MFNEKNNVFVAEDQKCIINKARRAKAKFVEVEAAVGSDFILDYLVDLRLLKKVPFERGTKVYDRRVGYPFKTVKEAVKVLNKFNIPVIECFDGNHERTSSSIDEYLDEDHFVYEDFEKICWAIDALQWAGFNDPEVLCAYDPASYAYKYETRL